VKKGLFPYDDLETALLFYLRYSLKGQNQLDI